MTGERRCSGEDLVFDVAMVVSVGGLLATSVALAVAGWWPVILFTVTVLVSISASILVVRCRR